MPPRPSENGSCVDRGWDWSRSRGPSSRGALSDAVLRPQLTLSDGAWKLVCGAVKGQVSGRPETRCSRGHPAGEGGPEALWPLFLLLKALLDLEGRRPAWRCRPW